MLFHRFIDDELLFDTAYRAISTIAFEISKRIKKWFLPYVYSRVRLYILVLYTQ